MQIALDRTDDHLSGRFEIGINQGWPEDHQPRLHGTGGKQHFRDKRLTQLKGSADFGHGIHHAYVEDVLRIQSLVQS